MAMSLSYEACRACRIVRVDAAGMRCAGRVDRQPTLLKVPLEAGAIVSPLGIDPLARRPNALMVSFFFPHLAAHHRAQTEFNVCLGGAAPCRVRLQAAADVEVFRTAA